MKKFLLLIFALTIVSNTFAAVGLIMPDLSGQTGTQVTVPVKVTDFDDIVAIQGTIQFDPSIVTYSSVQGFGLPGMNGSNFGTSNTATGKLSFSWNDMSLMGVTLADSATIFTITFTIAGTNAQVSNLAFVNSPTLIEVIDVNFNTMPTAINDGSITVQNPVAVTNITLFMDNAAGAAGSQMNVSMKAVDFTDIASIQGSIQFDPSALTFSSVSYFGLPGMNISNFNTSQVASGKITFTWFDGTVMGIDMADSVALFTLNFTHSCVPGTSSVDIVNTPTPIEVADASFNTLNTIVNPGTITAVPLIVSAMAADPAICEGTSTTLTASGASTYVWQPGIHLTPLNVEQSMVSVNPTTSTIYTVVGSSSGCSAATTVTVTVDPLPVAGFTFTDNGDGSVTFTSTSQNTTGISWSFGDGFTGTASPVTHTYPANGTYSVTLIAANSCGNDTTVTSVNMTVIGLKDITGNSSFEVYPNPNKGVFHIKHASKAGDTFTVQVVNTAGQVVFVKEFSKTAADTLLPFDLSALENGVYHVQIQERDQLFNSRILINK